MNNVELYFMALGKAWWLILPLIIGVVATGIYERIERGR